MARGKSSNNVAERKRKRTISVTPSVEAKIIDDHTIQFTEDGVAETVQVFDKQVVISNQETGERIVLTINGNTIHSSTTGKTITLTESEVESIAPEYSSCGGFADDKAPVFDGKVWEYINNFNETAAN